jgi:lactate dehydrogenase-like 2-hydroxyacid dehydrogenase
LEPHFTIHKLSEGDGAEAVPAPLAERIRGMVATTNRGVEEALIEALPKLEMIAITGGHLHGFPLESLNRRGIRVTNTPGVSIDDVADLVIGLLIAAARRIDEGDRFIRAGKWLEGGFHFGTRVTGKKLGIVGLGRIGRQVGRRAEAFRMDVRYFEPKAFDDVPYQFCPDLLTMAAAVDFLVLTCPTIPETRHLVDKAVLEALGPEGILVNVVRHAVDEAALIEALEKGAIGAAALDVFEDEPQVPEALRALENVVLSPHMAWKSEENRMALSQLTVDNLRAHFDGKPLPTPVI